MSEFDPKHPARFNERETPQETPGATGIFGVVSTSPAPELGGAASAPETRPQPAAPASTPQAPPRPTPVVVYEVKFQAQDADDSEAESSLQRLLQSLAPAHEATAPAPTAGDFTQLLSALQVPPMPAPPLAPAPVAIPSFAQPAISMEAVTADPQWSKTPEPQASTVPVPPVPVAPPALAPPAFPDGMPAVDSTSFTRLFEALRSPSIVPGEPHVAERFAAPPKPPLPAAAVPSPPAGGGEAGKPPTPTSGSFGSGADPASFTQLFNALGSQPRAEPSQAADYPPLAARKPSFAPFPAVPSSGFSGSGFQPAAPPPAVLPSSLRSEEDADLSSLTQLLHALEHPPAPPAAYLSGATMPASQGAARASSAGGMSGASGATVAFTPPESVQRRALQPPAAPSGPGDFTRVLQASALRESGLGSGAAAAQHPPAAPVASAPPVLGASAPLPPWAAPSMPYVPHVSGLAHANGGVPGLSPMPSVHVQPLGPHLHMQSAFMTPGPAVHGVQGGAGKVTFRGILLPLILLAIIVVLVGVLAALLLRH